MKRTFAPHFRRAGSGLLALGLALTGLTLVSSAAHAATMSATYVSDVDGVTTSTVDATVLENGISSISDTWNVCTGNLNTTASTVIVSGTVNVILGDSCVWQSTRIAVIAGGTLTFWSDVANTGRLTVAGAPAIGVPSTSFLFIRGGFISATGFNSTAGIGGDLQASSGAISILWRANVDAAGGNGLAAYGGGAGIGSGGATSSTPLAAGAIAVNTNGLVTSKGGSGTSGTTTAGANIGTGGAYGSTTATSAIVTRTVAAPTVSAGGNVQMFLSENPFPVTAAQIENVAAGSNVTYVVNPNSGYRVASAIGSSGTLISLGNNLYRFIPVNNLAKILVDFEAVSSLTLSASPVSPQTYPGNVTLSATFTYAGTPVAGAPVVFTVNGNPLPARNTNTSGVATLTLTSPAAGSYSFGASFAGDSSHDAATATPITGYVVLALQPDFDITAPSAADTVYGNDPFTLETTGQLTSGPVKWSVPTGNGVVSINPNTGEVTILAAGTVLVTAVAPADASHAAASASTTLTIAPREVTVTADDQTIQFGDPVELTWTASPELVGSDTLTGSLVLESEVRIGDIAILEDEVFENSNYTVTFVPGTLTVIPNDAQQAVIDEIDLLPLPIATWDQADAVTEATLALDALTADEFAALPELVLFRLDQAQHQAGTVNHQDPVNGVTAASDELPWSVRLVVTPETSGAATFANFAQRLVSGRSLIALYDIHFIETLTGDTWQPAVGSTVEVALSKVQLAGYNDVQVQHELVSGALETVSSSLSGTRVVFEGASFSRYGVSGVQTNDLPNTGSADATGLLLAGFGTLFGGAILLRRARRRA